MTRGISKKELKSTYNKIAEDWYRDHKKDDWWHEGTDKFIPLLPAGAKILDVGCGAGLNSRYLADRGFTVVGLDLSEKMIEIAKRENPMIEFGVWDIYEIDKYPGTFDAIYAKAVLLHIPKQKVEKVLNKLKIKLGTGGILWLAVKAVKKDGLEEKVMEESDYGYKYERFFSFFSMSELKKYFLGLGLEILWQGITNSGRTDWLQIIGRNG